MEKNISIFDAMLRFALVAIIFLLAAFLQSMESSLY